MWGNGQGDFNGFRPQLSVSTAQNITCFAGNFECCMNRNGNRPAAGNILKFEGKLHFQKAKSMKTNAGNAECATLRSVM